VTITPAHRARPWADGYPCDSGVRRGGWCHTPQVINRGWAWRLPLMAGITVGCILIGVAIVPLRDGGDPVINRYCVGHCNHAYPSWLWPTLVIAVLAALWFMLLQVVIVRSARRAAQHASGQKAEPSGARHASGHDQAAEGWYEDLYHRHEHRWISNGTPTALVQDAGVEAEDPPPAVATVEPLVRAVSSRTPMPDGDDLRRVGDGGSDTYDPQAAADAVMDATTWFPIK